ncbi:MAG: hypothetical protein RLZZ400_771 [Actinomycetota bacterium]|jgi:hypothetical protein
MRSLRTFGVGLLIVASLTGCTGGSTANPTESGLPTATIDPSLIPAAAPASAVDVDPIVFDAGYGDFTFKAGSGPVWCTINETQAFVICEIDEAEANYDPIPVPDTCDYSYGYQFRLRAEATSGLPFVDLPCSGGAYADPTDANVLENGQKITVAGITCWIDKTNARCDNQHGHYIALGTDIWATN